MSNKQRQAAYHQLVKALMECAQNDEDRILADKQELVDEGLVKALKDKAKMLIIQNNPLLGGTIQRLVSFAQQLERKLATVQSEIVELAQEDYIRFSFDLLKIVADSQGDGEIVHQFFDSHLAYLNVQLLTIFTQSIEALLEREKNRYWQADIGSVLHNLAIDLQTYTKGDRSVNFSLSIVCKERSLLVRSQPDEQILQEINCANDQAVTEIIEGGIDRQPAYFELVNALIQCPLNEEDRILASQPELVDKGLVIALLEVADIRREHDPDSASTIEWLESFAGQLSHKLELEIGINQQTEDLTSQPDESIDQSQEDRQTAYFELVQSLIQCPLNEEDRVLASQPELVDQGLVTALLEIAKIRKERNNPDSASTIEWLESFAKQLSLKLDLQQEKSQQIDDEKAESLLPAVTNSQSNEEIVHQFIGKNDNIEIELEDRIVTPLTPSNLPIDILKTNRDLGQIYFQQGEWQLAADAYEIAMQAIETSPNCLVDEQQQEILQSALSIAENALQCAINLENYPQAIQFIEHIRRLDLAIVGQTQVKSIDYAHQLIHSPHTAILTCYTTKDDTHIFIIKQSGVPTIHTCKTQGRQKFQNWLQKTWIKPCYQDNLNWAENLPRLLHDISQRLELQILVEQHLTDITELIIVPHFNLQHIPFAALPLTPTEGGLLGDRFIIRSIPSLEYIPVEDAGDRLAPPSVQSTLWGVDDYVSVIFNVMYQEQYKQDPNPAAALRLAQSRLRNLSGIEFYHRYYHQAIEYNTKYHPTLRTALEQHLEPYCQMDKPFNSPYYWAAFVTQGIA